MGLNSGNVHVVLVPLPAIGHCMPFLHFASRLAQLGVKVTFLCFEGLIFQLHNSPSFKPHARMILHKENIDIVTVKDGFSCRGGLGAFDLIREESRPALVSVLCDYLSPLMSSAASLAPCCIISDMMLGFTHDVAAKFNIPRYVLHTQSAANLSLMLQVPTLLADGILPLTTTSQDVFVRIPGLKVRLRTSELPTDLDPNALLPKLLKINSYENFLYMSRRAAEAPIVLVNTFRELEADVLAALDETGQISDVRSIRHSRGHGLRELHRGHSPRPGGKWTTFPMDSRRTKFPEARPADHHTTTATRVFGTNQGQRNGGDDVGSSAAHSESPLHGCFPISLWLESNPRKHIRRVANYSLTRPRRAKDELQVPGGRSQGGGGAESGLEGETHKQRSGESGETGDGTRGRPHTKSQHASIEAKCGKQRRVHTRAHQVNQQHVRDRAWHPVKQKKKKKLLLHHQRGPFSLSLCVYHFSSHFYTFTTIAHHL